MEAASVRAYDPTGNMRIPTPAKIGDEIIWKRNGTAGSYRCRILGFSYGNNWRLRVRVLVLSHDGQPIHRARWITDRGIMRVYPQARAA